jgi:hypothetical protein
VVRFPNAELGVSRTADPEAVQVQLARILGSPHFRNSKRSQSLLRYVVEASLAGDANSLKERCIGLAVFSREPDYDTAQDPIVRNAAIDVRKRLAQYYLETGHNSELRIELPTGSYQPQFVLEAPAAPPEPPRMIPPPQAPRFKRWMALVAAVAVIAAAAASLWMSRRSPASELDAFWAPLFREGKTVQICIGQPTRLYRFTGPRTEELNQALGGPGPRRPEASQLTAGAAELAWVAPDFLYLRDALAGFRVASWIQSKNHPYQLMSVASANYSQLRGAPLVAIGAFNNSWSMRVTAALRFVFDRRVVDGVAYNCIIDRRNPNVLSWKVEQPVAVPVRADYAIVTRVFDPSTEKTVVSAAGIETYGTQAAGEFVTQVEYLGATLAGAPAQWRGQNAQFVIATTVIDGTPGPPRVLASHYW